MHGRGDMCGGGHTWQGEVCMVGGHAWQGGMHGGGHVWGGVVGGMHAMHAPQTDTTATAYGE